MRGQEFRARDKKVQKMTRDGLTEKNLTAGTEQRVSKRSAEYSFGHKKEEGQVAGRHAESRTRQAVHKTAHKKSNSVRHIEVRETPRSDPAEENLTEERGKRANGREKEVSSGYEKTADMMVDMTAGHRMGSRIQKSQMQKSRIQKALQEPDASMRGTDKSAVRMANSNAFADHSMRGADKMAGGRRHCRTAPRRFERDRGVEKAGAAQRAGQDGEAAPEEITVPAVPESRRFPDTDREKPADSEKGRRDRKRRKRQAVKFTDDGRQQGKAERLHYEKSEIPPEERAREKEAARPRRTKQYKKAKGRVEKAERKLENAKKRLPTRTYIRWYKKYHKEPEEARHRLHFETETIPETEARPLADRVCGAVGRTASTAAALKAHQKIREAEADNVGVEASHKTEFAIERGAGWAFGRTRKRLREKPYREVRRSQERLALANAEMAYQRILAGNPQLEKKVLSKWIQKQKLKRKYAAAAREAAKEAKLTTNVITATGQMVRALAQAAVSRKAVLGAVGIGVLAVALFGTLLTSCSAMLSGVQSAIISTCYVAEDAEINQSELRYTELETDLQIAINRTEEDYPGYDEYRYQVGEIGHNPFELMGYLSAAYDDFTYAQVAAELNRLFGEQYRLTREEITEIRTYTDDEGEEQEYEWHVLKTTLSVRLLAEIIAESLAPGDETDRYGVYMQTCGNRQCYGNPFDFAWVSYVTSPYGYRVHPVTRIKDLHRGVDIGVAAGTPIKAVQDGTVVSAGNAGDYGLCVVVEGADGYQSRYAHCSFIPVGAGQEVKRGDVVAFVGSTGSSTGPHLHLEVIHNGAYLNPYYYVAGGGEGYLPGGGVAGSPDFTQDPGTAMGDGSFEAMLAEAEKYLGCPYVWGGSSPATSFDCSGYVSWVINQSGVGNVGRQTAQGLYNLCTPVSKGNLQPGDLVFFTGTYSAAMPVTHVGIYAGGGRMIHCGDPISYADLTGYWSAHFYSGGRLP